jgi:hypothetical protein
MERILNNFFIQRCDIQTIQYWESLLGLTPSSSETLDDRRSAILESLNNTNPISEPYVRSVIERMFQDDEYHLWFDIGKPYDLNIDIFTSDYDALNSFKVWLNRMCPAHLLQIIAKAERVEIERPFVVNNGIMEATVANLGVVSFVIPPNSLFNAIDTATGEETQFNAPPNVVEMDKGGTMFTSNRTMVNIEPNNDYPLVDKGGTMFTSNKQLEIIPVEGVEIIDLS